mgnify:CR=1 FL=1
MITQALQKSETRSRAIGEVISCGQLLDQATFLISDNDASINGNVHNIIRNAGKTETDVDAETVAQRERMFHTLCGVQSVDFVVSIRIPQVAATEIGPASYTRTFTFEYDVCLSAPNLGASVTTRTMSICSTYGFDFAEVVATGACTVEARSA